MLTHFFKRIQEKAADRTQRPVLIVAWGDSVTQGIAGVNEFLHDDVYHQQFKRLLEARFPRTTFSTINSGVDGSTTLGAMPLIHRDVIGYRPDLVLIGFALNDAATTGLNGLDDYTHAITSAITRIRQETSADIILLTPNWMLTRPNDAIPECYQHLTDSFIAVQREGILGQYAQRLRNIGKDLQLPVADIYAAWEKLAANGIDTTAMLANGLNHPNVEGHSLAAHALMQTLDNPFATFCSMMPQAAADMHRP